MNNMINKMTEAVTEVLNKRDALEEFLDSIDTAKAQHIQAIVELQEQLSAYEESFVSADDIAKAKQFKSFIEETKESISLVEQVNKAKVAKMYEQVAELAVETFSAHKEAVAEFKALDKFMMANTGLGQLEDNLQLMNGFANSLNGAFKGVRAILLDTGIVPQKEQNQSFRGTHLGAREHMSELVSFDTKIRAYIRELKVSGKM